MFGVSQSAHRMEDRRFLRGAGRYLDDIALPGGAVMIVLRSPYAHADISGLDVGMARSMPGVLAVLTAGDLERLGIGPLACLAEVKSQNGAETFLPPRPVLAGERVRYAGEPVAAVVAETLHQARDAAEAIDIAFDTRPVVTDARKAVGSGEAIWPQAPENIAFDWAQGDAAAVDAAFRAAAHVTRVELENNRVAGLPLEGRGAIGEYDERDERYTLHVSSQGGHAIRRIMCQQVLGIPENRMRVVTPDVGGGFGPKIFVYPEYVLALVAARLIGRPVKWVSERTEALQSDAQGRGQFCTAELALDSGGRFLAMRFDGLADLGAYPSQHGPNIATVAGAGLHPSVYRTGAVYVRVRGVFTNTVPTDSYRGAGRPEVIYAVERLVDRAARELGIDPAELRARNLVSRDQMPYRTPSGQTYDDGDFPRLMGLALDKAGYQDRQQVKRAALARGKLAGVGIAYFIDRCGRGLDEAAELRFDPSGSATLLVGSQTNGQGHETAYAGVVAAELGITRDDIRVIQGDTDQVTFGRGTGGSRALAVGGNAVLLASRKVRAKAQRIAAALLEAAVDDVEFDAGLFRVKGTNRTITITDCAKAAFNPLKLPADIEPGLDEIAHFTPQAPTFPNGCHVCWVEIDQDTARISVTRYVAVNDFGVVLNPRLVEGQLHGGLAQGIGQALLESVVYDPDSGQNLTGSLMDYCLPKSDDFGTFELDLVEIPCRANPLGVKGCGEAGAIAAPPTVVNAIVDALSDFDTSALQMPITADKVFALLAAHARGGA